jgi:hypothetical protein
MVALVRRRMAAAVPTSTFKIQYAGEGLTKSKSHPRFERHRWSSAPQRPNNGRDDRWKTTNGDADQTPKEPEIAVYVWYRPENER